MPAAIEQQAGVPARHRRRSHSGGADGQVHARHAVKQAVLAGRPLFVQEPAQALPQLCNHEPVRIICIGGDPRCGLDQARPPVA